MPRKSDKFTNVNYVKTHQAKDGSSYGYLAGEQFWGYDGQDEALKRAEEIAATGQPVVVKTGWRGMGGDVTLWQSFNSKGNQSLLNS